MAVPDQSEKEKNLAADVEFLSNQRSNFRVFGQVTGYGDDGADTGGGKSDVLCRLGKRNNMNTDSRHTDSSGRMGVQSTHRDNN